MSKYLLNIGAPRYPVLNAFMACRDRISMIMGPLGSGKTVTVCQRILKQMEEQEPDERGVRYTRWLAVRNTYPDLLETTVKDFREVFRDMGSYRGGGMEPPQFLVRYRMEDGTQVHSEMIFLALDREDSVRKLRGYQLTGVWFNEVKEMVKPIIDMADLRHGRYPSSASSGVRCTWHGMLGDTNASDEDHWYYRLAEEERPKGWKFFRQAPGVLPVGKGLDGRIRWEENPEAENLENLPDGYYRTGLEGKQDDWISIYLANEYGFSVDGKPVHPEYRDSIHTAAELIPPIKGIPLNIGLDFGRTPAAVITQHLTTMGRHHAIDEFCSEDQSAALFAPELKRYLDAEYAGFQVMAWGDPAGDKAGQTVETTPIQIIRANGIPCKPAPSNVPLLRRAAVANPATRLCMDGTPALLISPKCKLTRKGLMGGFCYRRLKTPGVERFSDEPDKNMYSHPVEALEYALLGVGEGHGALHPPSLPRVRRRLPTTAVLD